MEHGKIKILLAEDAGWADEGGNTLLHYAVDTGDIALVQLCLDEGVSADACNKEDVSALDVARGWGHVDIVTLIDTAAKQQRAASLRPLPYTSVQDIRDTSAATGKNIFFSLASRGLFDQVVALALKGSDTLTEADLLGKNNDGDTVILRICQQGQLPELLKPELWCKNLPDLLSVWQNVPKIYQEGIDISGFISRTRQAFLRSIKPRSLGKGPSQERP